MSGLYLGFSESRAAPIFGFDNFSRSVDGGGLNEDGDLDFVVLTATTGTNLLYVFVSDGAGGWAPAVSYPVFA